MVRLEQQTILSRWPSGADLEVMLWLDVVELHDLLFSRDVRVGGASAVVQALTRGHCVSAVQRGRRRLLSSLVSKRY